jgi:uncharacterized protein YdeI (YjbR/CyaY-like superfamily)
MAIDDLEHVRVANRAQWRAWLAQNHRASSGVWVVTYRKAARKPAPSYEELVLEALCFGWIDSKPGKVDEERTRLYFCPRRKGGVWAATNKARIEVLVAEGLMTPAGQSVIEQAKADGSWTTIDAAESDEVPDDLSTAFLDYPGSAERFLAFSTSARKAILQWIALAKRAETRARRIDETARLAQQGIKANQWSPKAP